MGRDNFEQALKERFEGAEIQPSESLWTGIEAAVANEEAARYRKGMAYYRWIAAAGILLLAGIFGYLGFENLSGDRLTDDSQVLEKNIAPGSETDGSNTKGPETTNGVISDRETEDGNDTPSSQSNAIKGQLTDKQNQNLQSEETPPTAVQNRELQVNKQPQSNSPFLARTEEALPDEEKKNVNSNAAALSVAATSELEVMELDTQAPVTESDLSPQLPEIVYGVPIYPVNQKSVKPVLWAGVNMTPGYFDPNYSIQSEQAFAPSLPNTGSYTSADESHQTGFSMTLGVEMGMKISDRWQVSSGIQYLNNNVQSSTDLVLDEKTPVLFSTLRAQDFSEDALSNVSYEPTELDNTFQFISIPVQAGYLLIDSKVKLLVNAGIASDIFLQNEVSAVDRSLESLTINPGSDAPFRSVYFNGLFGAQASYEILPRYMITLEPRYKMALSEFTKSDNNYSSLPSSFGIGVGVKYVFK